LLKDSLRATEPKLLHNTFTFLGYQIEGFYDLCGAVEKARSCLGTHGICIEHVAVSCTWSLEIQVVYAFLPVEALAHLFLLFFWTFVCRLHQILDEISVFKFYYYAFG